MNAVHVRLAALKHTSPDKVYRLNWLRGTRWHRGQLEIQAVFVPEGSASSAEDVVAWIRASDFPFLILDSRWYRGVMVGKPFGLRRLVIREAQKRHLRGVSRDADSSKLTLARAYPLAEGGGNNPVLEFQGFDEGDEHGDGYRVYLPLTETYRSAYFDLPIALPSIIGGLINGAMHNPAFEAWDPQGTHWVDQVAGVARITPARTLPQSVTKRLARSIFSRPGRTALVGIHSWIQKSFAALTPDKLRTARAWLPLVPLPYQRAVWEASVVELAPADDGRRQLLVLHIDSFDAPEPFNELEIIAPPAHEPEGERGEDQGGRGGKLLDPVPDDALDDVEDGWDPRYEPVSIEQVAARDERARRRVPRVVRSDPGREGGGVRGGREQAEVSEGSTQASGEPAKGAAPLVFGDDDPAVIPNDNMLASMEAVRRAVGQVVALHSQRGIAAHARLLPSDTHVYQFRVPASDSERARAQAIPRQFVIAEVCVGQRHAYVVEPERRSEHQPLPLGVVWLKGSGGQRRHGRFSTDQVHQIVQQVETSVRLSESWLRRVREADQIDAHRVNHAPGAPPSCEALTRFSNRIAAKLMQVVGDAAVIAPTQTTD